MSGPAPRQAHRAGALLCGLALLLAACCSVAPADARELK
jgi:hypothetical protein